MPRTKQSAKNQDENGDSQALLTEWLDHLEQLVQAVQAWATELDCSTRRIGKPMNDSVLGPYQAPALLIQHETTRLLLDPIARFAPGVEGVVDFYVMPAYDDIATLMLREGKWSLRRDCHLGPEKLPKELPPVPFSKKVFARVLEEMKSHAPEPL